MIQLYNIMEHRHIACNFIVKLFRRGGNNE